MIRKDAQMSGTQLFILVGGFIFGSSTIMSPSAKVAEDSWLAYLLGWAGGYVLISVYIAIARMNPDKTLIEILEDTLGRFFGKLVAILYIWYFIHLLALVLRNFGEFTVSATFPETPMIFIILCLTVVVVYAVSKGLEVIARISEVMTPVIPLVVLLVCLGAFESSDFSSMFPILHNGFMPVLQTGFAVMTFPFGETVAFLMIFPYLNKKSSTIKIAYLSFTAAGFILLITVFRDLIILGPYLNANTNFPAHMVARLIPGISIEPLIDINFMIGGGVKTAVLLFAASMGVTQLFRLKDYKPFVTAIAAFAVVLSVWVYKDIMDMFRWATDIYPYYVIPFQIVFPFTVLIISLIKRKKSRQAGKPR